MAEIPGIPRLRLGSAPGLALKSLQAGIGSGATPRTLLMIPRKFGNSGNFGDFGNPGNLRNSKIEDGIGSGIGSDLGSVLGLSLGSS